MRIARRAGAVVGGSALVGSVLLANWMTTEYGFWHFGPVTVTAGTAAAGVALFARDLVQDAAGKLAALLAITVGAALSFAVAAPQVALASVIAFTVAEVADLLVYTRIRARAAFGSRWWAAAVLASGLVGALVDTALFLGIAFGWPIDGRIAIGQLVGKAAVSLLAVLAVRGVMSRAVHGQPDRQPARA